jgi:hypothetical protein
MRMRALVWRVHNHEVSPLALSSTLALVVFFVLSVAAALNFRLLQLNGPRGSKAV